MATETKRLLAMHKRRLQFEALESRHYLAALPQALPLLENFDAGRPTAEQGWIYASTRQGVIAAVDGRLHMDDSRSDSVFSLNEAILHVDLSVAASVDLILDHYGAADQRHRFARNTFVGSVNADLIAVSVDGRNWAKVADLAEDFVDRVFPLDNVLALAESIAGSLDRSNVRIKIQQYDNAPAPIDGRSFDNVRLAAVQRPILKVEGNGDAVLSGSTAPQAANGTHLGRVTTQATAQAEFTLRNAGEATLLLDSNAPVQIAGRHAADFRIVPSPQMALSTNPKTVLAPGETTTFTVEFAPTATGTRQATLSLATNSALEPVYSFNIAGTGVRPPAGPLLTAALLVGEPTAQVVTRDIPFVERFEGGLPTPQEGWEFRSSRDGVIDVFEGQLRMADVRHDSVFSLNEAILHVDLSQITSVELTFDHVGRFDNRHGFLRQNYTGSANADIVSVSLDGHHWVRVVNLAGDFVGRTFPLDAALRQAEALAGTTDRSRVRIKFQQYDNSPFPIDGRLFDNIRVAAILVPKIGVEGNGVAILPGAKQALVPTGTQFGSTGDYGTVTREFVIKNSGNDPLFLTSANLVQLSGTGSAAFQVVTQPAPVVQPGQSTSFQIAFTPGAPGARTAVVTIATNDRSRPSFIFTIAGTGTGAPIVEEGPAAAGKRVKVVAPEFAGTRVYHTVYLPTNWEPGGQYPVIVEYAPNQWAPSGSKGTVDDTQLGYYLTKGQDFIWVTMPFIGLRSGSFFNATTWWGNGSFHDTAGLGMTAAYTVANLPRILEQYGGDPSRVLVTGFSRGAIATSAVALLTPQIADMWLAFIPHSHHDLDGSRLFRVNGRASFITYGSNDGGAQNSVPAANMLRSFGFPVVQRVLPGLGHTDSWVQDNASTGSLAVREELRAWIDWVLEERPGTFSISGRVTNTQGVGLAGVRIQSGVSHFTFTDNNGFYELPGLVNGPRTISASVGQQQQVFSVSLSGANLAGRNFTFSST